MALPISSLAPVYLLDYALAVAGSTLELPPGQLAVGSPSYIAGIAAQEEVEAWARDYCRSCGVDPDEIGSDRFPHYARLSYRQHLAHTSLVIG